MQCWLSSIFRHAERAFSNEGFSLWTPTREANGDHLIYSHFTTVLRPPVNIHTRVHILRVIQDCLICTKHMQTPCTRTKGKNRTRTLEVQTKVLTTKPTCLNPLNNTQLILFNHQMSLIWQHNFIGRRKSVFVLQRTGFNGSNHWMINFNKAIL